MTGSFEPRMLVDTDGGVDDLLALFVLSRLIAPSVPDVAVAFGNVPRDRAVKNVSLLASFGGIQVGTAFRGRAEPLRGTSGFALDVHGSDGIGGASSRWSAPDFPTRELERDLRVSDYGAIAALGPLSDIAVLSRAHGSGLPPLYAMGGAFDVPGHVAATAEFNFHSDPEAARETFDSYPNSINVISLDVCKKVVLTRNYLKLLCRLNPCRTTELIEESHQGYMDYYRRTEGIDGCYPHDTICACAMLFPDMFSWARGRVSIVVDGPGRGRSIFVADNDGPHLLAKDIDAARFFAALEKAMLGPLLGTLASGEAVYDSIESHARHHPTVLPHLKEALARVDAAGREKCYEQIEFSRTLGQSLCVQTQPGDAIVYARREGRDGLSRFVKNRAPEPASSVVVVLTRTPAGYVLRTAYVGRKAPAEPWDRPHATDDSMEFWRSHALVWGHESIVPGTETPTSPW